MRHQPGHTAALALGLLTLLLPQDGVRAAVRADRAPDAPVRLTVNDRSAPLAVDGIPQFGWLPRDTDPDEVQSAYQIRVTRGTDGATVWDTGRTASSRQSWVGYRGPALSPGATYRWTVRTWDRAGTVSPYAATSTFDTGLGDGDWTGAQWIRRPTSGTDAADEWTLARTVLRVGAGSPVVRARAYVAAPGDWALRVNGAQVTRGSSYGYPGEGYYDVADLPAATAGASLAIGVLQHYWKCTCQGRANGPTAPDGPNALLVKVVVEHADGSREVTGSDGGWRVTRDAPHVAAAVTYRNSDAGDPVEQYDATRQLDGWDTPGYDASGWSRATVVGTHPRLDPASCAGYPGGSSPCTFTHLTAVQAQVNRRVVHPVAMQRLADGTIVADLGRVYAAVPRVTFAAGTAGRAVTVTTGYRRANTTLAAATAPGTRQVMLVDAGVVRTGDQVTVDGPAAGYGPGDPEIRTVSTVGTATPAGTAVQLSDALSRAHAAGDWVQGSRVGTSKLDTQGSDLRFRYTQRAGVQTAEPFTYWGWRFLQIDNAGENVPIERIAAVVQSTDAPAAEAATFASSNATLDAVFALMQHSALQSAQNVFVDTPTREKGQFLGDAIDQSFATMEALNERALTRQAILDFATSQHRYWPNGALNAVYPNGDGRRDIPDYTEMFNEWVMRYYQVTGDADLVTRVLPTMRRIADYVLAAVDGRGLVYQLPGGSGPYQYGIVDWPPAMRYDSVVTGNGARTVVNALAVGALRAVAAAAAITGDTTAAQTYGARAAALAAAMNARLRRVGTGYYSDGLAVSDGAQLANSGAHAQSYPLAYGVAPADSYAALGSYLNALGMRQGPMDLRQLLTALHVTGRTDTMVRLLTDRAGDGPARILAEDGTFMWEQWTPGCVVAGCTRAQVNQGSTDSFSHGWGAAGSSEILRGLLGVSPTAAGAATVLIAPPARDLAAVGLTEAHGTVWTERGPVSVGWRRSATGYALDATVPVNMTATIVLPPPGGGRRYRVVGARPTPAVVTGDGRSTFTVGSGSIHLRAGA